MGVGGEPLAAALVANRPKLGQTCGHQERCLCLSPPASSHSNPTSHLQLSLTQCHLLSWSLSAGPMGGGGVVYTKDSNKDFCYIPIKTYRCSYFGIKHVLTFVPLFKNFIWNRPSFARSCLSLRSLALKSKDFTLQGPADRGRPRTGPKRAGRGRGHEACQANKSGGARLQRTRPSGRA